MTGNSFRRNIIYYTDPHAALFTMETVPLEHNQSDFNVVYHAGQPLRTGVTAAKSESGPNLLSNAGLEEGEIGKAPIGWNAAALQDDGTQVRVVNDLAHAGTCSAFVEPARMVAKSKSARTVYLTLGTVPYQPGKTSSKAGKQRAWTNTRSWPIRCSSIPHMTTTDCGPRRRR